MRIVKSMFKGLGRVIGKIVRNRKDVYDGVMEEFQSNDNYRKVLEEIVEKYRGGKDA